ncbi:MAG: carboxylesterase [Mariprofundales bacterium]|nr:carboxylesterase [Mariprofundales bacterium]
MPFTSILPTIQREIGQSPPDAAIIWLHGLGADGHDFEPIIPQLGIERLAVRFILPHAPAIAVTVNGGYIMPAWYDITSREIDAEVDHTGMERAAAAIARIIEREQMRGIAANRVIVAGFSQGAVVALKCGLHSPPTTGGIIALSGYLPFTPPIASSSSPHLFIGHGTHDSVVPYHLGERAQNQLKECGYRVAWHSYPIDHGVSPAETAMVGEWIKRRLAETTEESPQIERRVE